MNQNQDQDQEYHHFEIFFYNSTIDEVDYKKTEYIKKEMAIKIGKMKAYSDMMKSKSNNDKNSINTFEETMNIKGEGKIA